MSVDGLTVVNETTAVLEVTKDSPAAKAGLRPGDYVRSIDGQSTRDTTVFEGTRLLQGKAGTKVKLAILRGNLAPDGVVIKPSACAPHLLQHSGRALVADNVTWFLYWTLQAAVIARLLVDAFPSLSVWLTLAAIVLWCAALLPWAARASLIYLRPRADGRPG